MLEALVQIVDRVVMPAPAVAPPAPPIMTTVAPPTPTFRASDRRAVRFQVDVTVRSADRLLWEGPLWVGSGTSTTRTMSQSEPRDPACAMGEDRYIASLRNELSLSLTLVGYVRTDDDRVSVRARWTRPASTGCDPIGDRSAELTQVATFIPGERVSLRGDGGLEVQLRRR